MMSTASNSSLKQSCSAFTSVTSALEVNFNVMRSINLFMYLYSLYLLTADYKAFFYLLNIILLTYLLTCYGLLFLAV